MSLSSRALFEVVPERLLDDDAPPAAVVGAGQAAALELLADRREEGRRDGQVERLVAAGAPLGLEGVHRLGQQVEGRRVVEDAGHEAEALGEGAPHVLAERRAGVLLDGLVDDLAEVLVGPVAPREADEREARRQQTPVGEVVDGRHELLAGEVARSRRTAPGRRGRRYAEAACRGGLEVGCGPGSPGLELMQCPYVDVCRESAATTCGRPASWSVRCSRSTGRPCSASTWASPAAWAAMNSPKVKSRPGTARSSRGAVVTCR